MRYEAIIDRYSNIIRGILFGHTERDEFQLVQSYIDWEPAGVTLIHPGVTTYTQGNPSYRVYYVDPETNVFLDYDQFRLYLNESNISGIINWRKAYNFQTFYTVKNMSVVAFLDITNRMKVHIYIYIYTHY